MIRPDFQDVHLLSMQHERAAKRLAEGWSVIPSGPGKLSRLAIFSGGLLIGLGARLQCWAGEPAQGPAKVTQEVVWR